MVLESMQKLILAFVTLIVGIALLGQIAISGAAVTGLTDADGEVNSLTSCYTTTAEPLYQVPDGMTEANCNLTMANVPTGWVLTEGLYPTNVDIYNSSRGVALTTATDYIIYASTGIVALQNTSATELAPNFADNSTLLDYDYYPQDYLNLSWGRTILNLVGGFFAIALMLVGVGLFFSIGKDYGII